MVIDYIPAGTPAYEKFRQQRAGATAFQDYIPASTEPEPEPEAGSQERSAQEPGEELVPCPICQKEVKPKGVHAHIRKAHPDHQFIDAAWVEVKPAPEKPAE